MILHGLVNSYMHNNLLEPFHTTAYFLYPLKTSKNHRFTDAFRGYGKRPVV